ncbi:MAG: hypothetical protein K2P99_01940 [Burkholderiales bacterium]|nr:hypothetical protein [Burkholderiales bacterium]
MNINYYIALRKKNRYNMPYDIIFYNNKFYAGSDLFRNFASYISDNWNIPVKIFTNYTQAKKHYLSQN